MKFYTIENKKKSISKTYAIYFICMAVFCLMRILNTFGIFPDNALGNFSYSLLVQIGILFLLPLFLYSVWLKVSPKEVFKSANFAKISFKGVLISFAIGILTFFITVVVSSFFNGMLSFTGFRSYSGGSSDASIEAFLLNILIVAILPAIGEEFLHRGILLQGIKHIGFKKAIVISSVLFGLIHFNVVQTGYAIVIGLILGFVSVVAKNIYPAIIVHFVNNFIVVYLDFAGARGWVFGDMFENLQKSINNTPVLIVFVVSTVLVLAVVALLFLCVWALYRQTIVRKVNKAIEKVYKEKPNSDTPIIINEQQVIRDLLENNTLLNLNYQKMDSPIDYVMPKEKSKYKALAKDQIFLWGAIILGTLITFFTYIWGLV